MLKKNIEVWLYLGQLTFALAQSIFGSFEQLTEQTSSTRLKIWHGWSWEHIKKLGSTWGHFDSRTLMQHKTLIWVVCLRRWLIWPILEQSWAIWRFFLQYFEKYERENFGVQHLPPFNLLKPEDVDWLLCLSWSEGGRGLNTRVPRNLHSHEVILDLWYREWAYRCHL